MNTYDNGLYICDIDAQGNEDISFLETAACIGDCKYNPFMDHFLVSLNAEDSAKIIVIDNDQNNTVINDPDPITIPASVQYLKEMFIAPNGRLYVFADMLNGESPRVLIYAAHELDNYTAYQLIGNYSISLLPSADEFVYYSGNFCYNPANQTVYGSIHPTEVIFDPYLSVQNSMFDVDLPYETNAGSIFTIDDNGTQVISGAPSFPGQIICPYAVTASQYDGFMFVIGKELYVIDCSDNSIADIITQPINDIAYSPYHDRLYALVDVAVNPLDNPAERSADVFEIIWDGSNVSISQEPIADFPGQATSMFFNQYDNRLYLQHKFDQHKLGATQVRLISFDPAQPATTLEDIDLGFRCFNPELDHNGDFHYYFYNITTPHINPYNHSMYIPNGGHSCVSKVSFNADEAVLLNEGTWAWMSFPRLDTDGGDPSVHEVLYGPNEDRIDPMGYLEDSEIRNIIIGEYQLRSNVFNEYNMWPPSGQGFHNVNSIAGYKLKLLYTNPPDQKWLLLSGDLIHPDDAVVTLSGGGANPKENWLGYYLPLTQSPFDAIDDDIESNLSIIKAQNWMCYNEVPLGESVLWRCACNKGDIELKYGDMVIVKTRDGIDVPGFQWQFFGNPISDIDRQESEYYEYTETADYTPIFIELDTTENPVEIGAFVEDSCVGATTVMPDDSLLLISAYTEGLSGEVYFEEYYGTQKSTQPPITDYYVTTPKLKFAQKRLIHTNEQEDYYVVSFKEHDLNKDYNSENKLWIKCIPNPVGSQGMVSCHIPIKSYTEITLYDMTGTLITVIHKGMLNAGDHEFSLSGNELPQSNGIFLLSVKTTSGNEQLKIMIMK